MADEKTPEQLKQDLLDKVKTQVHDELEKREFQSKADVDAIVTAKMKQFEGMDLDALRTAVADVAKLRADLLATSEAVTQIRAAGTGAHTKLDRKTIASQIRSTLGMDKNDPKAAEKARQWNAFKNRETTSFGMVDGHAGIEIETRAPQTITLGGLTNPSAFIPGVEVEAGLTPIPSNTAFIEQYADTRDTSSPRIVWAEKTNRQGNAAFIGEGVVKPLISFEFTTNASYAKKVADKIKTSTEMLDDVDFMAAEIENELQYQVNIKVDADLLAGTGTGTQNDTAMKGLRQWIGGYALTSIQTTVPNNFDAVRSAAAQIASMNFTPNRWFLNPIDSANMDLAKDSMGRPLAVSYKDANGKLYNILPVETNQMPVGYFLIGDMTKFTIRNYKPFAIYYGWVNDDFEKNLVTIIGERRLHAYVKANQVGAFVYDSFANVKTAITAA